MKFLIIQNPTIKNMPLKYDIILDKIIGLVLLENKELFNKIKEEIKNNDVPMIISDIIIKNASYQQVYDENIINIDDFAIEKNKAFIEKFLSINDDYSVKTEDDDIYIIFNIEFYCNIENLNVFEYLKLRLINVFLKYNNEILKKYNEMIKYPLKIEEIDLNKLK